MIFPVCPFCGIASERAHDSQQACIEALKTEIDKARELLATVDAARGNEPKRAADRQDTQTT
jgi:hypothetical protein